MTGEWTLYQVDAFTDRVFGGNPAAVLVSKQWLSDSLMQNIAAENNLAETAFVVPEGDEFAIRWFTPELEIDLCGHATLASAHVLFTRGRVSGDRLRFRYAGGTLDVERQGDRLAMDFPSRPAQACPPPEGLAEALGAEPSEVLSARDLLVVFRTEAEIRNLQPDFGRLAALDTFAVIVTAPGSDCDFVSRFFAPRAGIPEDPVTGSAHCTLVPYWSGRLGRATLEARQISRRGGRLFCEDRGERVTLAGHAVDYLEGTIRLA